MVSGLTPNGGGHVLRQAESSIENNSGGPGPVFVGGSGRSGTTILGKLIGHHPRFARITNEVRFHAVRGGYPELLRGDVAPEQFCQRLRDYWFERPGYDGRSRGLSLIGVTRDQLAFEIQQFQERFRSDPDRAAEHLLHGLLDQCAAERGRPSWVESTPKNVRAADVLTRVFPSSRVIHIVRDGRDVAASVVGLGWGPSDLDSALRWWADRLIEADAACRDLQGDRILTVRFEDMVVHDREYQFERLVGFLGGERVARMREFFDREVTPDRSNAGRWRTDVDASTAARFDADYANCLVELVRAGVTCLPRGADELVSGLT